MIIIRMLIAAVICLSIIVYVCYVLITSSPCERIDRATLPVRYATDATKVLVKPWSHPETLESIDRFSARTRLKAALFFRIQFYSDRVPPVICDWDAFKDTVLNEGSYFQEKDNENRSQAEEQSRGNY